MKTNYLKFLSAVGNLKLTGPDRSFAIAAAVASSVADFMPVPASKVDSPNAEYVRSSALLVRDHIGCFNETAPFDVRLALELSRKFWMLRYDTVHVRRVHDVCPGDYFCGYFNVSRNFSKDEMSSLNTLSEQIGLLEITVRDILQKEKQAVEKRNADVASTEGQAVSSEPSPVLA